MEYVNPIISGFYPDPSICRVGDDFYLVNSSFEYFPGIPVFHSKDLINWEQTGHCISRPGQLALRQGVQNCVGIYAPTIRYHDGIFYVISTNVTYGSKDDGNFIVWTDDSYGEWSDPVFIDLPGIDSSLFFDDDGKVYYTGAFDNGIFMSELEFSYKYDENGKVVDISCKTVSEKKFIWYGTGGNDPEGPHLYKINGWYYLLISEGGTEFCHMITVARSRNIWGEYVATIEKFEYMAFPRLLAIAEVAWSQPGNKNRELFISHLKKEFSFFQKRNVNTCREYFRPRIQGGWDSEKGMYAVTLETICPDADIRYTLDGSEPTVESDIYEGPVYLTENTCVKAVVTDKDNQILEAPTVKNFLVNKATGCTYTLSTDAWSLDWYPVKPTLFTDGVQGFTPSNYEWAAIASGVEIVIDLKKNTTVSGVRFGTMVAPINSTLPAKSMICYLSKDGKEFRQIGESTFSYPVYKGEKEIYHNYVKTEKKDGRYLKLVINGQTELPEDYPYPNALPSIALDEIEVF